MAPRSQLHAPLTSPFMSLPIWTFLTLPFIIFLLSFPAPAAAIGSAVIGIDVGTEYLKAALVKPGIPLEIVLTKDSKRKESAAVAFKPTRGNDALFPERFYGGDALALAARYPDDVYANLKTLLGVPFDGGENEIVKTYWSRYPDLKLESAPGGRGTVGLRSNRLGESQRKDAFLVEELLAMQLKQIKGNADSMAGKGSDIRDVVIAYPSFYTAEEKRSLELAAELAGLNVEALVTDGLAVGLNYAMSRTFPSISEGQKPQYHVVYDMGAGSTTASVLQFHDRVIKDVGRFNKTVHEVQVLGTGWDRTLGGDVLNELIVDDMIESFAEDKKLNGRVTIADLKAHGKTMAKLWKDAEKLRQILSANTETSTSFESLFEEDLNFRYKITRSKFEKLAEKHAARVAKPLEQAILASGLELDDIDSIILHGGAIRTPFVQKELEKACGSPSKIRTSVNADEAAVFGASFKGASLSPSFRVKDIRASDAAVYPVLLKWSSGEKSRHMKLFTPTSSVGTEKQVTVKNLDDFELEFYQQIPTSNGVTELPVLSVGTKNLTASVTKLKDTFGCTAANATTNFSIRLNPADGLPEVVSGWVACEVEDTEKKGSVVDDVKGFFGLGSKKDEQEPLGKDVQRGESITLEAEEPQTTMSASENATSTTSVVTESKKTATQTKLETIPIGLTSSPLGTPSPSPSELNRIRNRLAAFDSSDNDRILREEALNELESFIYRSRDLVEDDEFVKALKADQLALLKEEVAATGDWLYGDGTEAKAVDFQEKLKSLQDIVNPALKRKSENSVRPARVQLLQDVLGNVKTIAEVMEKQIQDDEETFSSSASAASSSTNSQSESESSTSESASSSTTTLSSDSATPSSDPLDELDDDPYSSSSSSSMTTTISTAPAKLTGPKYTIFQPSDLSSLTKVYEATKKWFETQLALQEKLVESDDPALTVSEIDSRIRELDRVLTRMYQKMGATTKRPAGGRPKKDNGNKEKAEKAKSEKQKQKQMEKEKEKEKASRKDEL